jgi:prepilin peptidase dependent protein B
MKRTKLRGLSLVEAMIGLAIGMIVVAGAITMTIAQLGEHRRLALETQIQQDLRAASDLMLRDLRRAGFWEVPDYGVWAAAASAPMANPYSGTVPAGAGLFSAIDYSYSRHKDHLQEAPAEDNAVTSNEQFGFRVNAGTLQFKLGGSWQPLTDPNVVRITGLQIRMNVQEQDLRDYCLAECLPASTTCPPRQQTRRVDISISAAAVHDPSIVRSAALSAKLRNDRIVGSCGS